MGNTVETCYIFAVSAAASPVDLGVCVFVCLHLVFHCQSWPICPPPHQWALLLWVKRQRWGSVPVDSQVGEGGLRAESSGHGGGKNSLQLARHLHMLLFAVKQRGGTVYSVHYKLNNI